MIIKYQISYNIYISFFPNTKIISYNKECQSKTRTLFKFLTFLFIYGHEKKKKKKNVGKHSYLTVFVKRQT